MKRIIFTLILSAGLAGTTVWANEEYSEPGQQPGVAGEQTEQPATAGEGYGEAGQPGYAGEETSGVTATTAEEATKGTLKDEVVGIRPQLGTIVFKDNLAADRGSTSRAAYGFTLDMNALSRSAEMKDWYLGPSTGLIYSHVGASSSNFFGTNANTTANAGSNFFYIPVNLKVGYNIGESYRVAAHGGGNLTYRSIAQSMFLSSSTNVGDNSVWRMYPNIGADFEANLGKNVALTLRPDVTMTPGDDIFTGTLALAIPLS